MKSQVVAAVLFGSMWHGYRRWMTFFNVLSIVLSVMLTTVMVSFSLGVRRYIDDLVRKEAAAGAVRANYGDVFVVEDKMTFEQANHALSKRFTPEQYQGFNLWWRSESHQLMLNNPLDLKKGGVYSSLGNTFAGDPEAERVADFRIAGSWITDNNAHEIVLTLKAARALLQQLPDLHSVDELIRREVWLALPPTFSHDPTASALVRVVGVYAHLRDGACMTTAGVIQKMYSRILANANGTWQETYDLMHYKITDITPVPPADDAADQQSVLISLLQTSSVPLVCWRIRDLNDRWLYLGNQLAEGGGQRTEVRSQKAEGGRRNAEGGGQRANETKTPAVTLPISDIRHPTSDIRSPISDLRHPPNPSSKQSSFRKCLHGEWSVAR